MRSRTRHSIGSRLIKYYCAPFSAWYHKKRPQKITQGNRKTMSEENKIKEAYLIYYISPVYENQDCHDTYALPP